MGNVNYETPQTPIFRDACEGAANSAWCNEDDTAVYGGRTYNGENRLPGFWEQPVQGLWAVEYGRQRCTC